MNTLYSYTAGFLDADGSIYVRLKPNSTYNYDYQVSPSVVFFQNSKSKQGLQLLQSRLKMGYLRERNDKIIEYTIGDQSSIISLLQKIIPFLIFKKQQAELMLKILSLKKTITTAKQFVQLAKLIDIFGDLNYSTKRKINAQMVRNHLLQKGILTP